MARLDPQLTAGTDEGSSVNDLSNSSDSFSHDQHRSAGSHLLSERLESLGLRLSMSEDGNISIDGGSLVRIDGMECLMIIPVQPLREIFIMITAILDGISNNVIDEEDFDALPRLLREVAARLKDGDNDVLRAAYWKGAEDIQGMPFSTEEMSDDQRGDLKALRLGHELWHTTVGLGPAA